MAIETIGYSAAGGWSIPRLFAGAEYTASLAGVCAWPAGASGARLVVIAKVRGGVRVAESAEMTPDAPTARISFLTAEFRDIFRALYPTDSVTVRLEVITAEGDLVAAANQACGVSHLLWREEADSVPSCPSGVSVVAASLAAHVARMDNPHAVTAEQCGADVAGTAEAAVAVHDADLAAHADIRSSVASAEGVAAAAQSASRGVAAHLAAHEAARGNPHGVTAEQIGAGVLRGGNRWIGDQLFDHSIDVNEGVSCGYLETPGNVTVGGDVNVSGGIYLRDENGVDFYKLTIENGVLHISDEPIRWMNET